MFSKWVYSWLCTLGVFSPESGCGSYDSWISWMCIPHGYDQYLLIPFLMGWTSIYQLFRGSLGTRVLTHPHISVWQTTHNHGFSHLQVGHTLVINHIPHQEGNKLGSHGGFLWSAWDTAGGYSPVFVVWTHTEANLSFHLPDKPKSKWFCKLLAMSLRYLVSAGGIGKPISTIGAQHCGRSCRIPEERVRAPARFTWAGTREIHQFPSYQPMWTWRALEPFPPGFVKARRNCWIWDGVAAGAWFRLTRFRISASPAWKAEVHQGFDTFPYDVPTIRTGYSPEVGATAG